MIVPSLMNRQRSRILSITVTRHERVRNSAPPRQATILPTPIYQNSVYKTKGALPGCSTWNKWAMPESSIWEQRGLCLDTPYDNIKGYARTPYTNDKRGFARMMYTNNIRGFFWMTYTNKIRGYAWIAYKNGKRGFSWSIYGEQPKGLCTNIEYENWWCFARMPETWISKVPPP